ncbi:hypothetical protein EYR40_009265 [Pleurotus pulmonarius]|nr:hypothetical protein EYR36_005362 [Pleurotus pulmonarius]KAF4590340.1 hypothetical protein EYR38_009639 [Pleurotus pulmonarius]KAF4590669.1 hypothetical protein EYR40_009265 [Pleurotus pulmonarius]
MSTPELDHTLSLLSSHRTVLGYIVLSRGHPHGIVRQSGVIFDGEHGRKYATAIGKIMENVQSSLDELSEDPNDGDEVRFLRIRTKRHEIMISPDDKYLLAVLHDPAS